MCWFKRKPKHKHKWRIVGYGGCGWHVLECETCGANDII